MFCQVNVSPGRWLVFNFLLYIKCLALCYQRAEKVFWAMFLAKLGLEQFAGKELHIARENKTYLFGETVLWRRWRRMNDVGPSWIQRYWLTAVSFSRFFWCQKGSELSQLAGALGTQARAQIDEVARLAYRW